MAAATRRNDHFYLVEITKRMRGAKRNFIENRQSPDRTVVALAMLVFGIQNFMLDLGSFRMPSLIPLTTIPRSCPMAGVLIALFTIEQLVNGWRNGFEGPEDADDFAGASVK